MSLSFKSSFLSWFIKQAYIAWTFINLYVLGSYYALIELRRSLQWPWPIRQLDVNRELPQDLSKVVAVITGASRGIGLETSRTLLSKGARLIICTSQQNQNFDKLQSKLKAEFNDLPGTFELVHLNLSQMNSVLQFVQHIKNAELKINLLINNAGIMFAPFKMTKDQFESHLATNYLGHALLTILLLPILSENTLIMDNKVYQSRIVNVSSSTHFSRNLNLNNLNGFHLYSPYHAYAQSKLAQIMFTYRLIRKEIPHYKYKVSINCVHPGVVYTGLYEYVAWVKYLPWLAKSIFRTSQEGSETVLYAAVSPELHDQSGHYLEDSTSFKSSSYSYNVEYQDKLYQKTIEMLNPWIPTELK